MITITIQKQKLIKKLKAIPMKDLARCWKEIDEKGRP